MDMIKEMDMYLLDRNVENNRYIQEAKLIDMIKDDNTDDISKWLALDLFLVKAEMSAGLMDGLPIPGGKQYE